MEDNMNQPMPSDFEAYTYDASNNLIVLKSYRQNGKFTVASVTNNTGTITIETDIPHNIILEWDNSYVYDVDTYVKYNGVVYISTQASTNKDPRTYTTHWAETKVWQVEEGSDVVYINGIVGMTDLNGVFTVIGCPNSTSFDVTLSTVQTYTSGGTVKRGAFQYKWLFDYDTSNNLLGREIFYTDI